MATSADTLILVLVGITVVWAVISVLVMRRVQRRRNEAAAAVLHARPRSRRLRARDEGGEFVPLARLAVAEPESEPEPEPGPEPEAEPPRAAFAPPQPALDPATTYEIVWYREEDRLAFALQPVDGRAAPWARYRSASFSWAEDRDPPASLRSAQRAHGRLRARLDRDGWRPAGRGKSWFNHRVSPPGRPPERPHDGDD